MRTPGYQPFRNGRIVTRRAVPAVAAALCAAAVLASACSVRDVEPFSGGWEVDQQALQAWVAEDANPNLDPGVLWTSRMWISPNPLIIRLPEPSLDSPACGRIAFASSIGSEPLTVTGVRYEGLPLVGEPSQVGDGVHIWTDMMWPFTFSDGSSGGGNGFGGQGLCVDPLTPAGPVGTLIFETDDPAVPEVRVAVQAVPQSDLGEEPEGWPILMYHSRLHFGPNPVRLARKDGPTTVEVAALRIGEEPMTLWGLGTLGPDVTVESVSIDGVDGWDGTFPVSLRSHVPGTGLPVIVRIRLRYDPQSDEPRDDAVMAAFDDGGREAYRVAVPIVVR